MPPFSPLAARSAIVWPEVETQAGVPPYEWAISTISLPAFSEGVTVEVSLTSLGGLGMIQGKMCFLLASSIAVTSSVSVAVGDKPLEVGRCGVRTV